MAFRQLLRPLVRLLLRSGVTWKEFADISKATYVEVAGEDYGLQGRPTNTSRVAILTGLSRREVKKQRDALKEDQPVATDKTSNAGRVLAAWHQDPDFVDKKGNPRDLAFEGKDPSFSGLLRRYAGDIPPVAMLKELKNVNAVKETKSGKLRAVTRYYMPAQIDPEATLRSGNVLRDVAATVTHNLIRDKNSPSRFEGRATNAQIPSRAVKKFEELLEKKGEAFLYELDDWLSAHEVRDEKDTRNKKKVRLGVGVYLIKDEPSKGSRK